MLPSLYISHGSPALMIMDNDTTRFLKQLPSQFDKPKYILVVSAHWVTRDLKILYKENPGVIYDFYNFPRELYELEYKAKSSLEKSDEIIGLFESNGIKITKDTTREGYDHGVWSILRFIYPKADIPVIQLSLPISYDVNQLMKVGEILSKLKDDTLIIASGALTHNLRDVTWDEDESFVKEYAKVFRDWIVEKLENNETKSLMNFYSEAPYLQHNHPTLEHFLPLYVSLGASKTKIGNSIHSSFMYGNQAMDTIIFKE